MVCLLILFYLGWMSTKVLDVQVDPLQSGDEIAQTVVAGGVGIAPLGQGLQGQEPEYGAPVVHVHKHDAVLLGQSCTYGRE